MLVPLELPFRSVHWDFPIEIIDIVVETNGIDETDVISLIASFPEACRFRPAGYFFCARMPPDFLSMLS